MLNSQSQSQCSLAIGIGISMLLGHWPWGLNAPWPLALGLLLRDRAPLAQNPPADGKTAKKQTSIFDPHFASLDPKSEPHRRFGAIFGAKMPSVASPEWIFYEKGYLYQTCTGMSGLHVHPPCGAQNLTRNRPKM